MKESKTFYYVLIIDDRICNVVKAENGLFYSYFPNKKKWVENPSLIKIVMDITDYEEISKEEAYRCIDQENEDFLRKNKTEGYKELTEYDFRDVVGHFVLIKNTDIVDNPNEYKYIDDSIESIKQDIIRDTKDYYTNNMGYKEEDDYEDTFNLDALNEEMTTRKVNDLTEPLYGYIGIEINRGLVVYLLGNKEDKLKYVYGSTYWAYHDKNLTNAFVKVIDDEDYEYVLEFKNQIQNEEERDENVIKTRALKEMDPYRLDFSPDFVNCIVPYKKADYSAKVKLKKFEDGIIYGTYHNQEGILELVKNDNNQFLLFRPTENMDEDKDLKEYIDTIADGFKKDYNVEGKDVIEIIKRYSKEIEKSYIKGDLPFEIIRKIMDEILDL